MRMITTLELENRHPYQYAGKYIEKLKTFSMIQTQN